MQLGGDAGVVNPQMDKFKIAMRCFALVMIGVTVKFPAVSGWAFAAILCMVWPHPRDLSKCTAHFRDRLDDLKWPHNIGVSSFHGSRLGLCICMPCLYGFELSRIED